MPEKCEATPGCTNVGTYRDAFGVVWCRECTDAKFPCDCPMCLAAYEDERRTQGVIG